LGGRGGRSSTLTWLASGVLYLGKVMVGGKLFGLLRVIQSLISKLSRDPCPCQSNLWGVYQVVILSLFAGSVKRLAAAWTTNLVRANCLGGLVMVSVTAANTAATAAAAATASATNAATTTVSFGHGC
jgi:hypothetical protein